jgi:hypothetical protein
MLLMARGKGWGTSTPPVEHIVTMAGFWVPLAGMVVGLAGRPKLILAIVPASLGTMFFWVATTLP